MKRTKALQDINRSASSIGAPGISDDEVQEKVPEPIEDIVDMTERQLWCTIYVEAFKETVLMAKLNRSVDKTMGPDFFGHVADEAVTEYRKRYGAERKD